MIQGCRRLNEAGNDGRRREINSTVASHIHPKLRNNVHEPNMSDIRKMYRPPKAKHKPRNEEDRA